MLIVKKTFSSLGYRTSLQRSFGSVKPHPPLFRGPLRVSRVFADEPLKAAIVEVRNFTPQDWQRLAAFGDGQQNPNLQALAHVLGSNSVPHRKRVATIMQDSNKRRLVWEMVDHLTPAENSNHAEWQGVFNSCTSLIGGPESLREIRAVFGPQDSSITGNTTLAVLAKKTGNSQAMDRMTQSLTNLAKAIETASSRRREEIQQSLEQYSGSSIPAVAAQLDALLPKDDATAQSVIVQKEVIEALNQGVRQLKKILKVRPDGLSFEGFEIISNGLTKITPLTLRTCLIIKRQ